MNVRPERVVLDQETYDYYMKQARRERAEAFAWVFGGLCWVTTLTRVTAAADSFGDDSRQT